MVEIGDNRLEKIREEVKQLRGVEVGTIWGPSEVVGIVTGENGKEYIHLKEFGEEDYTVPIEDWYETLQ